MKVFGWADSRLGGPWCLTVFINKVVQAFPIWILVADRMAWSSGIKLMLIHIVHKALKGKASHNISELLQVYTLSRNVKSSSMSPYWTQASTLLRWQVLFFSCAMHLELYHLIVDLVFLPQNSNLFSTFLCVCFVFGFTAPWTPSTVICTYYKS